MNVILNVIYFLSFGILSLFHRPVDDSEYYLARASEVLRGRLQIGNPYFYEHRNDLGISFLIPDWLTAIPGSFFIFPVLTAVLIFLLLKKTQGFGRTFIRGDHLLLSFSL